jgi:hypothetical protein
LKTGDIIELPFGKNLISKKKKLFKRFFIITKKAKKRSYLNFLNYQNRIKKKKYKFSKIFSKLNLGIKTLGIISAHDPILNVIGILNLKNNFYHDSKMNILKSSVLSLQN